MASVTKRSDDIITAPINTDNGTRKLSIDSVAQNEKKKKFSAKSLFNFFYNPKKKTVLGRGSLNWGKVEIIQIDNHLFVFSSSKIICILYSILFLFGLFFSCIGICFCVCT